jgi:hypothetical protein
LGRRLLMLLILNVAIFMAVAAGCNRGKGGMDLSFRRICILPTCAEFPRSRAMGDVKGG